MWVSVRGEEEETGKSGKREDKGWGKVPVSRTYADKFRNSELVSSEHDDVAMKLLPSECQSIGRPSMMKQMFCFDATLSWLMRLMPPRLFISSYAAFPRGWWQTGWVLLYSA